ncbi:MAG: zf-HC2 domain-containing protein [Chloroflexota bacterium]|nr:zf-HC2 domain-containing protein [Chloroflexota bacterium]
MVPADMNCQDLVELVTEYMEGRLPTATRAAFEAHILECDGCEAYVDQMRHTVRAIGALTEQDVEPEALARMLTLFRDWKRQHHPRSG